jgi:tRNA threonylcarbamoyl adenosine modification protein (Sua5/YciO/YrdC/YwlC family)
MLIKIHPEHPSERKIGQVIEIIKEGGVIIYPTDTVYGLGCDIFNRKAVEKVARIKGVDLKKANFSFICNDLSHLSDFTMPIDNNIFKLIKNNTPGPFTFILSANNNVPKLFMSKKKTVGIRIPDNLIVHEIVKKLGNPVMTTSILDDDEIIEYTTDPELIYEKYQKLVDLVIDGGIGGNIPSTVIDCTKDKPEVLRQGLGEI